MRFRKFGKTGLQLSTFTLGGLRYIFDPAEPKAEEKHQRAIETIRAAVKLGINHFETAHSYGNSEALLGEALSGVPRDSYYITTKFEPGPCADSLKSQLEESLARLRTDRIDNLAIHGVNNDERLRQITCASGCMKAIEKALEEKTVGHLGFTTHGSLDFVVKAMNTELFEWMALHYSYFHQRNLALLDRAGEMQMGVLIISPAGRAADLVQPPKLLKELCDPYSPAYINHRFILQHPAVTSLVLGISKASDYALHKPAFENDGALCDAEIVALAKMDIRRMQLPDSWCTFCHECLPCPANISIPEILRLRNLSLAYDMGDFAKDRYRWFETDGHWFPSQHGSSCDECGDCLPRCPEKLDIPRLLRETHTLLWNGNSRRVVPSAENC